MIRRPIQIAATLAILALAIRIPAPAPADPEHVAARMNESLPKPYIDGLEMQRAHVEGKRLVVDIRIPYASIDKLDWTRIPTLADQERRALYSTVCDQSALFALWKSHYEISRRFLDRDGKIIFELVVPPTLDCKLMKAVVP